MAEVMTFPETVEEFMEEYKVVDSEHVYTNGTELVPIFRMKQWFAHLPIIEERKTGKWIRNRGLTPWPICSECGTYGANESNYCSYCGARMEESERC